MILATALAPGAAIGRHQSGEQLGIVAHGLEAIRELRGAHHLSRQPPEAEGRIRAREPTDARHHAGRERAIVIVRLEDPTQALPGQLAVALLVLGDLTERKTLRQQSRD